jgi:beta-phosphoglucomutase-like phosphatase (HAD superfamily)
MLHAVLFELEGVLVGTHDFRRQALEQALAVDGLRLAAGDAAELYSCVPTRTAVAHALSAAGRNPDDTAIDLAALRAERAFLAQLAHGFAIADGAHDLLASIAGRCRLGLVTRATRQETDVMLTAAGLDVVFDLVVTADDVRTPKPSPAPYLHALALMARRRPIVPSEVVALEDGWAGIVSARDARVRCVAVGELAVYSAMHADALIPALRGHTVATLERLVAHPREYIA